MSQQIAHLAHDHSNSGDRTIQEWAEITRRNPDSVMKQVARRYGKGIYTRNSLISADQFAELYAQEQGADKKKSPIARQQPKPNNQDTTTKNQQPRTKPSSAHPFSAYRQPILYTLMAMPAAASVQNMYSVSGDIAAHSFTAFLLTGLFSATPFLFVLAGMSNGWTKLLAGIMITYECFCNVTRIYGGLTGFGRGDFPTRFLGLVCEFFNSGTYATAKVLAIVMAAMAAAVFYAAFIELQKDRRQ